MFEEDETEPFPKRDILCSTIR